MGKSYPTKSELALIFMVKNDYITAEVLNAMWGRDYGSETLRDMARRGWAVEMDLSFKVGIKARAYKRTCFAITQKGIDYLDKCGYDLSVLVDDYNPIYKYAARKTVGPADAAARLLKEITANIFFEEFGVVTLPIAAAGRRTLQAASGNQADAAWDADIDDSFFDLEADYVPHPKPADNRQPVTRRPYIPDLIRTQQKKEIATWSRGTIPENTFYFCARSVMRKSGDYPQEYRELSMSECAGVLATAKKAVLVYTASTDGMLWNSHSATADSKIARAFCFNHHIQNSIGDKARGILLASAPSVLASLFFNRSKRKMRARFGTGLTALHVVPISQDGMTFLHHIMEDDLVKYRLTLCQRLCDTGAYTANAEFQSMSEYPVIETATDALCAYGIDMDYNYIAGWYDILSSKTNRQHSPTLKIICFEFQLPYYHAIFGDLCPEYILAPPL